MADEPNGEADVRRNGMGIRTRMQLLAVAVLVPYLLFAGFSAFSGRQDAIEHALGQHEAQAHRVAIELEGRVEQVQALLVAAEISLADELEGGASGDRKLRALVDAAPGAVAWLSVVDPQGRITASSSVPMEQRRTIDLSDRDYFRAAMQTRAFAISAPIVARTTGAWIVIMARPVLDSARNVRAVVLAIVELSRLGELVDAGRSEADSQIAMSSDKGLLMLHAPRRDDRMGQDLSALPQFAVARSGGTFRGEAPGVAGERVHGVSVPVRNAPWQVFYAVPYELALASADRRLATLLVGASLMLLIAILAGWWFGRGLLQPILGLRRGVNALARGNLAHRVEVRTGGEIAALAADINRMAAKLGEAEQRLRGLAALSSDFFWETDADFRFTRVDGEVKAIAGDGQGRAIGKRLQEIGLRVTGDFAAHRRMLELRHPFRDVELARVAANGAIELVLLVSGEPQFGAAGEFIGYRGVGRDVTERNRLEAEVRRAHSSLARSEERLRSVVELSSDWIWESDAEHRISYVSSGVERTLDIDPRPAVGRTRWEGPFLNMSEADWAAHRAQLEQRLPFSDLRLERLSRAGRRTVQSVSGKPVFGPGGEFAGYRGVGRDVTAQVEAERALLAERDRLARVLETMAEGLSILDAEGRYALINASAARILGVPRDALLGRHYTDVPWTRESLEGGREDAPLDSFACLRDGATRHIGPQSYVLRHAAGTQRILTRQAARLDDGAGGFGGVLITFEDITDRVAAQKAHEREILELNADLERRVEMRTAELTQAYKEMESFSYSVSHDLRAPLRAISGFSRILLEDFRGEFPAEAQRLLGRVAQNAERMGALIDGLLEFGRLSRQPLRLQRIRPADVVREVLDELAALREGRRVDIRIGDMPECRADRVLLKQVYANLVANAIKYTGLRTEAKIEVGSITMGLGPVYYVRDNGAGFDMAYAGKLFAMFERLHLPSEFEGNGVGLALVRRILERHGGKVWADSAPDKGATFFFRLGDEAPAASAEDGQRGRAAAGGGRGREAA